MIVGLVNVVVEDEDVDESSSLCIMSLLLSRYWLLLIQAAAEFFATMLRLMIVEAAEYRFRDGNGGVGRGTSVILIELIN